MFIQCPPIVISCRQKKNNRDRIKVSLKIGRKRGCAPLFFVSSATASVPLYLSVDNSDNLNLAKKVLRKCLNSYA